MGTVIMASAVALPPIDAMSKRYTVRRRASKYNPKGRPYRRFGGRRPKSPLFGPPCADQDERVLQYYCCVVQYEQRCKEWGGREEKCYPEAKGFCKSKYLIGGEAVRDDGEVLIDGKEATPKWPVWG